jgi:predicted transcriptional regulator
MGGCLARNCDNAHMRDSSTVDTGLKQLKAKLQRGAAQAARGELLDADEVFQELRLLIDERKRAKKKAIRA